MARNNKILNISLFENSSKMGIQNENHRTQDKCEKAMVTTMLVTMVWWQMHYNL